MRSAPLDHMGGIRKRAAKCVKLVVCHCENVPRAERKINGFTADPSKPRFAATRMSVADAWIAASAMLLRATLVHKDPEFDQLDIPQHRLPYK